ncbi:MAG: hypothetical protein WC740_22530 [Verrucomicrobiia bacterium]
MNWLDTQTKEILQKAHEPKLAPSKTAEFALVLIQRGMDPQRLLRAICRINECSEPAAIELIHQPLPLAINSDLRQEDALWGQFELICCDAIGVFVRSEVLEQSDDNYIHSLFQTVLHSPEFRPVKMRIVAVPPTEAGNRFIDQFLGIATSGLEDLVFPFGIEISFKKARIMKHWAGRIGAQVQVESST